MEPGHGYYDISSMLLKLAIQANDRGDFFPVPSPLSFFTLSPLLQRPPHECIHL
jgi:hypothetical protein